MDTKDLGFYRSGRMNLICGGTGRGKTVMARQWLREKRPDDRVKVVVIGDRDEYPPAEFGGREDVELIFFKEETEGYSIHGEDIDRFYMRISRLFRGSDRRVLIYDLDGDPRPLELPLLLATGRGVDAVILSQETPEEVNEFTEPVKLAWEEVNPEEAFSIFSSSFRCPPSNP